MAHGENIYHDALQIIKYQMNHNPEIEKNFWQNITSYLSDSWVIHHVKLYGKTIYQSIIVNTLAKLYIFGPNISGFGFCKVKNRRKYVLDYLITMNNFGLQIMKNVIKMIERQFYSWIVLFEIIIYFLCLYRLVKMMIHLPKHIWGFGYKMFNYCYR